MTIHLVGPPAGDVGGSGGIIPTSGAHGFGLANNLSAPLGELGGSALGFTSAHVIRMLARPSLSEDIFACRYQYSLDGGYVIGVEANRWKFGAANAAGSFISNFGGAATPGSDVALTDDAGDVAYFSFPRGDLLVRSYVLTLVVTLTQLLGYVNGERVIALTLTGGYLPAAGTITPYVGRNSNGGVANVAPSVEWYGGAYVESILTPAQVLEHARACYAARTMVEGGQAWDELHSLESLASVPATLSPLVGSVDLTLNGALSIASAA